MKIRRNNHWPQRERRRRITRLVARDGEKCWLCGGPLDRKVEDEYADDYVTFDHVVPQSKGGKDDDCNVRLAHQRCNIDRGSRDTDQTKADENP